MMTDEKQTYKLIKDMGAVFTPVFYIFGIVAVAAAIIVCGFEWITIIVSLYLIFLAACAAADINKGIVPDLICILIAILAVICFFMEDISVQSLISRIIGSLVLSVPMLIAALLVKGGFGGGDIKMMAASGLFLGLNNTIIAGFIAFLIAGIYGVYILLTKNKGVKSNIKIAPYLALGCAISELFGSLIMDIIRMKM